MKYLASDLVEAPGVGLITVAQAKGWIRGDPNDTSDDEDIQLLIDAVLSHLDGVNGVLRRALIHQDWVDIWNGFPHSDTLALVLAPVAEVLSIVYYDAANVQQTLAPATYTLHRDFAGAYLKLANDAVWPSTYSRDDAVSITYTAGYGATAADVPAEIRLVACELIEAWYGCDSSQTASLPARVMTKLRRFIRPHF